MSPEQETVRQNQAMPAVGGTPKNGVRHTAVRPARPVAMLSAADDQLQLRVSFPRKGEYFEENSRLFPLPANRWERLAIPLPVDWQGGGLRLDPRCRFGLMEIVGIRIVSGVMGESLWEMLGRDLIGGVRVSAGMQVLSNNLRLRLLCTGDDAQIVLPDLMLPSAEVPLVLEIGLRVRTELTSIGYSLHEWVDDANTKLRDALAQSAAAEAARAHNEGWAKALLSEVDVARADGNQREAALREQLAAAHEAARAHAAMLLSEIDVLRTDGNQREAALREQLAAAHEAARAHAATLTAEIETARAYGEERATTLLTEIDTVRTDGNQREMAAREQLAAAHEAARTQATTLLSEIETARAYGEARAATLLSEIEAARIDGNQREAALREQLAAAHEAARAHAATLTAEIEAARAYGEERAAALTAQNKALRAEENLREVAFQEQLTAAHEAARAHAATLTNEIEMARAHGSERAAALTTIINEARLQAEQDRAQLLELSDSTVHLERQVAEQRGEFQRLKQMLRFSNQEKANVHAELAESRRLAEEHRGRVRSMQRSVSWRLTLPLRIVGRVLTGRRPADRRSGA